MNKQLPFKRIAVAGFGAVLLTAGASALADPPARVARLAYLSGPVSFAPAGDNTWEYAAINRPLIAGDRLWVDAGARDEVQVGGAALRMGASTLVTLLNIDDRTTQLQLSQGRLNVHVRSLHPNDVFEIDTPNLALSIRQPGDYRIDVDPVGNATMVAVPRGQAEVYGDGNAYRLGSGQGYIFGGTDLRDARPARADLVDDFDRWAQSRDQRIEQSRSVRYVSPDLVGYEDLDDQGTWSSVPDYGNVWMPAHVSRDWAPYRDGHWTYVQPWGWTWVDDAPWGFAVSHYGRWARFPQGWGWVPGPRAASPVYAPALVAFISIGAGAYAQRERPVAWFPLAPREVYRPSYRASQNYITNINVTNTALGRNQIPREGGRVDYANRRVGGAVTAVPATAFVHAQPVSRAALALPVAALAAAAIAHNAPVAPERDSMRGHGNPGHQPPAALMARQVLAKNAPPPALRRAPMPQMRGQAPGNVPQGAQIAAPAPRIVSQDRRAGGAQLREVPVQRQAPVANAPDNRAMQAMRPGVPQAGMSVPSQPTDQRQRDQRMNHGQRGATPAPAAQMPAPLAHAPVPVPAAIPAQQQEARGHGRDRMPPPPQANVPAPLAHAPTPVVPAPQVAEQQRRLQQQGAEQQRNQQQAESRQRQQAAEQQHNQQQVQAQQRQQAAEQQHNQQQVQAQQRQQAAEQQHNQQQVQAQQRQQQAAEQQRAQQRQQQAAEQQHAQQRDQQAAAQQHAQQQQVAAQQQAAAQQQRAQQQAAAEQRRATERPQHHDAPAPPAPAAPHAAQPAQAPQQGNANDAKKEDKRHRDHPEQN